MAAKQPEGVRRQNAPSQFIAPFPPPQSLRDSSPLKGEQSKKIAQHLRRNATEHERWLWTELRLFKKTLGCRFRRQVVLGPYIVDFACHKSKMVIEVDGNHHAEIEHAQKDGIRDKFLENEGYKVLRFWNAELHEDWENILDHIADTVTQRMPSS
ncbi:endonuclease domain-containing protein [Litorimonas sp.]|uniref:endonuclease domain-containing protein n=1 Tax=Litorimonas sp. TaxID=1892381 RepID=UPI003A836E28